MLKWKVTNLSMCCSHWVTLRKHWLEFPWTERKINPEFPTSKARFLIAVRLLPCSWRALQSTCSGCWAPGGALREPKATKFSTKFKFLPMLPIFLASQITSLGPNCGKGGIQDMTEKMKKQKWSPVPPAGMQEPAPLILTPFLDRKRQKVQPVLSSVSRHQ